MKVHIALKRIGETPLEALRRTVKERKLPENGKYTYAGRLDPMAEGVLVVLQNASQADREKYLKLPKEYHAKVLFGIGTDTWDILGIPKNKKQRNAGRPAAIDEKVLREAVKPLMPFAHLPVPAYSSVPVEGTPGFAHARAGKKVLMPLRKMEIKSIVFGKPKTISALQLRKYVFFRVKKVRGDFRQKKILESWNILLKNRRFRCQVYPMVIRCGSGTYVRSVAEFLGNRLKTKALLYGLVRTRVGKYSGLGGGVQARYR